MSKFNLTEIALKHKSLMYYFIIVTIIIGAFSYTKLGRMEDPDFVIRKMVVSVAWPGATAEQVEEQVTDKIEKKLQETPNLDYLKSYSRPGSAVIYVTLKETSPKEQIRPTWLAVRNLVQDIQQDLPQGVVGPFFNDHFDDVYGSIYALTSEGFSYEEMRQKAERIRRTLVDVDNVKKVELIGVQEEKIYIEMSNSKLTELGIAPSTIADIIRTQNAVTPAGMIETDSDNVHLRFTGMFNDLEAIRNSPIRINGNTFRLGDIATVERGYNEPADDKMFFNGKEAIGIAVSMEEGGNNLVLGEDLRKTIDQIKEQLPLGIEIHQVSNQPQIVKESIEDFTANLREAVIIVLFISFISLGLRTGLVVAFCIPLVLCGVFLMMYILGIDLHKVSLGALIISLSLLVDDEIVSVEIMSVKLEEGFDRFKAASFAYVSAAIPMLSGTFITCAGFIPVGFSKGMAAEFTSALFPVIALSLIISWVVATTVAPLLGTKLIRVKKDDSGKEPYSSKFYVRFGKILRWCLNNRKTVLASTFLCFLLSIFMLRFITQEFFPPSVRPELIVEMTLHEGSSMKATEQEARRLAQLIDQETDVKSYSYYVGEGAPRFVLTTEPVLPSSNYAQFVIVANDAKSRKQLEQKVNSTFVDQFPNVRLNTKVIQTGPPAAYPVMLRISGYEKNQVQDIANQVAMKLAQDPNLQNINFDWNEKGKAIHLELDQDKMRNLGISGQNLGLMLQTGISGSTVAEFYEQDRTINIVFRMQEDYRTDLEKVKNMPIYLANGQYVPLEQIAKISYEAEDASIWRRDLKPTITLSASILKGTPNDTTQKAYDSIQDIRDNLPFGYSITVDGALENSNKSIENILQPLPFMIFAIITILMFQLQRVSLMFIVLLTAPMGIIGVSFGMLIANQPMGFIAQLGILSLSGIIIRNSIILIAQIEQHMANGEDPWNAVIDSAILRFRPIMLTAAASILGMIPLMRSNFWGPMAVAIASGLLVATILTLLVLPTMYATYFKIEETPDKVK